MLNPTKADTAGEVNAGGETKCHVVCAEKGSGGLANYIEESESEEWQRSGILANGNP